MNYYNLVKEEIKEEKKEEEKKDEPKKEEDTKAPPAPIKPKFEPIDLESIILTSLKDKELTESEEHLYSNKSHPYFKILQTLMLLADVFSYRQKSDEALKIFNYVQDGYFQLFGTNDTILNSYLTQ